MSFAGGMAACRSGPVPGGDRIAVADGVCCPAYSPTALLKATARSGVEVEPQRTLVLDLASCRRVLQRGPERWPPGARGDLRETDDLLWDAAPCCLGRRNRLAHVEAEGHRQA